MQKIDVSHIAETFIRLFGVVLLRCFPSGFSLEVLTPAATKLGGQHKYVLHAQAGWWGGAVGNFCSKRALKKDPGEKA